MPKPLRCREMLKRLRAEDKRFGIAAERGKGSHRMVVLTTDRRQETLSLPVPQRRRRSRQALPARRHQLLRPTSGHLRLRTSKAGKIRQARSADLYLPHAKGVKQETEARGQLASRPPHPRNGHREDGGGCTR